jgi:hypothetical protein
VTQQIVLTPQFLAIQCAGHRIGDLIGAEGFEHKVCNTSPQRSNGSFKICVGSDQDRIAKKTNFALLAQPVQAGFAGHDIVENHQIKIIGIQKLCRRSGAVGLLYPFAARPKNLDQKVAHARLVVNNQNRCAWKAFAISVHVKWCGFCGDHSPNLTSAPLVWFSAEYPISCSV